MGVHHERERVEDSGKQREDHNRTKSELWDKTEATRKTNGGFGGQTREVTGLKTKMDDDRAVYAPTALQKRTYLRSWVMGDVESEAKRMKGEGGGEVE